MNESERGTEAGASRRSVLKAAAWATPVVVMMTAAPLAAATGAKARLLQDAFEDLEADDSVLLIFAVTGAAEGTPVVAQITSGYPGVAGWWDTDDAVTYSAVEADGNVYLFAVAHATGTFTVNLTIADFIGNFPVTVAVV